MRMTLKQLEQALYNAMMLGAQSQALSGYNTYQSDVNIVIR